MILKFVTNYKKVALGTPYLSAKQFSSIFFFGGGGEGGYSQAGRQAIFLLLILKPLNELIQCHNFKMEVLNSLEFVEFASSFSMENT